jgi:hypothetical protein
VLEAEKGERTAGRQAYRSGYYGRTLITRVGKLELRVPQDRAGRFSTELFERYQRSERALVAALAEIYVQSIGLLAERDLVLAALRDQGAPSDFGNREIGIRSVNLLLGRRCSGETVRDRTGQARCLTRGSSCPAAPRWTGLFVGTW